MVDATGAGVQTSSEYSFNLSLLISWAGKSLTRGSIARGISDLQSVRGEVKFTHSPAHWGWWYAEGGIWHQVGLSSNPKYNLLQILSKLLFLCELSFPFFIKLRQYFAHISESFIAFTTFELWVRSWIPILISKSWYLFISIPTYHLLHLILTCQDSSCDSSHTEAERCLVQDWDSVAICW